MFDIRSSLHRILHTEDIQLSAAAAADGKDAGEAAAAAAEAAEAAAAAAAGGAAAEVRISHADYKLIASQLIDYIKQAEAEADCSAPFQGVSSRVVIEW